MKKKSLIKRIAVLLLLSVSLTACSKVEKEDNAGVTANRPETKQNSETALLDGTVLLSEDEVNMLHTRTEDFLDEAYSKGTTAQLTSLTPAALYLGTENGEVTQAYDAYKASFTSPEGVRTDRYSVVYYRNLQFLQGEQTEMISDAPIHIGQQIEVSATPQDGGYIIGYRSLTDVRKDVLGSMETNISHQITEN